MTIKSLKYIVVLIFIIGFSFCANRSEDSYTDNEDEKSCITNGVIGTVIGSYYNGWTELIVQIDKKYQIGKTIEYVESFGSCIRLPKNGIYQNLIRVQLLEGVVINQKMFFFYREYKDSEDEHLFFLGHGNALCEPPNVPLFVVTDYQFLKNK